MKKLLLFYFVTVSFASYSQEDAWVFFKDKPNSSGYLSNPLTMLSQRSIDRRTKQNIAIDINDVPIEQTYYSQIKNASGIEVLAKSKWMNSVHIRGTKVAIDALKSTFSFIEKIEFANKSLNARGEVKRKKHHEIKDKFGTISTDFNYGVTSKQVTMIKADFLHKNGYTGEGMHIAVMDAGFPNVNSLDAFKRLRDNNRILGGYDFVNRSSDFYTGHNHGTNVLSDIGGYIENEFVGTAPDASFYLFITEDVSGEGPIEESLWVEAAERADSLGVDVVNTSLGYTVYNNTSYSHTYDDMDGKTTFISRGAEKGASKGIIFVTSAGNSGNSTWKYISAPADAASVFTVGAVNGSEVIASFSSFGPTSDNRIKPDVLAHGQSVYVINHTTGNPSTSNGTSFSSPVMAGAVACFWQAFPSLTYSEIMQKIRESADRYANPTDQHGYGIPDFEIAFSALSTDENNLQPLKVFPNPVSDILTIQHESNDVFIRFYTMLGKEIFKQEVTSKSINIAHIASGMYILQLESDGQIQRKKIIKK